MFKKYKALAAPGIGVVIAIVIVIAMVIIVYPGLQQRALRKLSDRWKKIEKNYEEVDKIKKEQKRLQEILDNINKIAKDRILWARRLNDVSDSLPPEIQLTELLTRLEKPKDKSERTVLVISGLVPAYPGEKAISDFIKGLRENQGFVTDFPEIEPPSTETLSPGFKKFSMKCYMKEVVEEPKTPPQKKKPDEAK